MTSKKLLGLFLSCAIAAPSLASTTTGLVKGQVSLGGRGVAGLAVTLVNVETGRSFPVKTAEDGSFEAAVPPGSYVFSSPGRSGISIARAPLSLDVASGKTASALIEMAVLAVQAGAGSSGTGKIIHEAVDCIAFDRFTMIEASFEPLTSVVNGRLYFQSNLSPEWFYTQFELIQPPVPGGPTHRAFIPKVVKGGGITNINYYAQLTSSDFAETRSPEKAARVVEGAGDCNGKLAPLGTPTGPVSVFSASGSAVGGVAGFAGATGGGLGAGTIAAIAGGAAGAGVGINQLTNDASPTPIPATGLNPTSATPNPAGTPTPTPLPTPTATPTGPALCSVTVSPVPEGGSYCRVAVDVDGSTPAGSPFASASTVRVACTSRVSLSAVVTPPASTIGTLSATWSGNCGGSGGTPCIFYPTATDKSVALTCVLR